MSNARFDIVVAVTGAAQAQAAIRGVAGAFDGMRSAVAGITGLAAFGTATAYLREAWKAAEEARVSVWQLEQALTATGQASRENSTAFEAQAGSLQTLTGVADESVREVQRILLSMGGTVEQVQQLTPLVLDLSAAMGMDATSAARQLGKALDGGEVSFGKLGIKAKDFNDLLAQLNSRVKGQAESLFAAKGAAAALDVQLGEISESVGHFLAWSANPFIAEVARAAKALSEFLATPVGDRTKAVASFLWNNSGTVSAARGVATLAERAAGFVAPPPEPPKARTAALQPLATGGGAGAEPDEEEAAITAETARRAGFAQEVRKTEAAINGEFAVRRQLISQDPEASATDKRRMFLAVLKEELPIRERMEELRREEYARAVATDPASNLQTTLDAEEQLSEAQLQRLDVAQQIRDMETSETYFGALSDGIRDLSDQWGNLSVNLANGTLQTVTAMVNGLAGALTAVIMGTQSAGAAFRQFGISLLTNFVTMILTAVLWAKVAIPILTALGVVSGGSTAATGAGVTTAALAMGSAAASSAVAGFETGGLVSGGERIIRINERGPEFVVNAEATRRFLPALEAINNGASVTEAALAVPGVQPVPGFADGGLVALADRAAAFPVGAGASRVAPVEPAELGRSEVAGATVAPPAGLQASSTPQPAPAPQRPQNLHVYIDRRAWVEAVRDDMEGIAVDAMKRA